MNADESARHTRVSGEHEPSSRAHLDTGDTQLGRRIHELSAHFMREVLAALASASATEIGQLLTRSGGASLKRAVRAQASERGPSPRAILMRAAPDLEVEVDLEPNGASAPHDPFDITSPGDLLAPRDEPPHSEPNEPTASPAETPRSERSAPAPALLLIEPRPAATDSSTALRDVEADAASERRPKVVLREGERLLSATGSGVVIRRERRIVPKEST